MWAEGQSLSYRSLDERVDRVAATLQHHGCKPCDTLAVCAASPIDCVALFLGALRAGLAVAPLAPSSTAAQLAALVDDAKSRLLFLDAATAAQGVLWPARAQQIRRDDGAFAAWLLSAGPAGKRPAPVVIDPAWPFNLIYSSGTTGTPKGIVQPHAMRWAPCAGGTSNVQRCRVMALTR